MNPSNFDILCSILFGAAILHTFLVFQFQKVARKYPDGSMGENAFHLLGEVEVVFGLWAGILFLCAIFTQGYVEAVHYFEGLNFLEPVFVFVIMTIAATGPILYFAERCIQGLTRFVPNSSGMAFYVALLIVGPLLGSFITEPAAMTVTALLLKDRIFDQKVSLPFKYATLGLLFVNISIGGTLTQYAAPPVLMVAAKWNWDLLFMIKNFGYKAVIAILINTSLVSYFFRRELVNLISVKKNQKQSLMPWPLIATHILFLAFVVINAHHMVIFVGAFLFFIGVTMVTKEYQSELRIKEALLVALFLGGLVALGGPQRWWLEPILLSIEELPLFLGSAGLTAFVDNAALTYLGAQVPNLSEFSRYALVAGAVVGGGLTVIANAPNPAGYGILQSSFPAGISPWSLFKGALLPTLIALLIFWFLPSF